MSSGGEGTGARAGERSGEGAGERAGARGRARLDAHDEHAADPLELMVLLATKLVTYRLPASGSVTIGRSSENDVRVDDPSVSRRHARLHVGPPLVIEDLGSANGVRVRDAPVSQNTAEFRSTAGQILRVQVGDVIALGAAVLVVRRPGDLARPSERGFVVRDDAMRKLHTLAGRVAQGTISVLLLGETGVGKEILAEVVHRRSPRRDAPFLRLNCAALSESLLESELFGHEKGAFTGAVQPKAGLLETAEGGTVFLDEVGELAPAIQVKLLRVLEERKVTRVGGLVARPIDVRLISATNRDLEAEARRGAFRSDLFFRLNGISLTIPPLRARPSEIEPLARMFAARAATQLGRPIPGIAPDALEALARHPWPGNVRELRNVMERAVVLLEQGPIELEHLILSTAPPAPPAHDAQAAASTEPRAPLPPAGAPLRSEIAALERQRILDALEACAGNQTQAAALLGMSRRTFVARLGEYQIRRPRKR